MLLWIYPNKYMKDVDNRACSSFPARGQSLSGIAIVIVKWARFSAFGYLQKVLIGADFGWLQSNGHYAEGDTGRANTQLHSRSPWLHTALHAPALPVGAPRPPALLPAQRWINKQGREQEVRLQGGQKGVCSEASAPAAGCVGRQVHQERYQTDKNKGRESWGEKEWQVKTSEHPNR